MQITYLLIIVMFLSAVWAFWLHPFTAQDPIVSKWCNAEFLQIFSERKQTHLYLWWAEGEYIFSKFFFCENYFFKCKYHK